MKTKWKGNEEKGGHFVIGLDQEVEFPEEVRAEEISGQLTIQSEICVGALTNIRPFHSNVLRNSFRHYVCL